MEWAIEKATELGVAAIAPIIARRTEKHLAQAAEKRAERWRRIVHEASQQSRRSDVPAIHDPVALADRVRAASTATRIVLAEQERTTTLRAALEEAITAAGLKIPHSKSPSALKVDGRRKKKRSSTRTVGARSRWARAFCARRRRPSLRWPWPRRCWNDLFSRLQPLCYLTHAARN